MDSAIYGLGRPRQAGGLVANTIVNDQKGADGDARDASRRLRAAIQKCLGSQSQSHESRYGNGRDPLFRLKICGYLNKTTMDNKKTLMIVGGIVAVGAVGYFVMKNMKPATPPVPPVVPLQPLPAQAAKRASAEPRGKLPWATGDVSLWDDE